MNHIEMYHEYTISAFLFACLAIIGSFLSVINMITLFTTCQLIITMKKYDHSKAHHFCLYTLFSIAIICTLLTTYYYTTH